ncbi:MAG: acetyl-CoA carboxylase, carboxyltransferase subunit beta [Limnochordia bacterium]|jgi:acetyl-CoA carboxylase carboxyl transferase subunit beta
MLKDFLRGKQRYVTIRPKEKQGTTPSDGMWTRCPGCDNLLFTKELAKNLHVCDRCDQHFRVGARERVAQLIDGETFQEIDADLEGSNPLGFAAYEAKLTKSREQTGLKEAFIYGEGKIGGYRTVFGAIDFGFIGGTMGSVVGEKVSRAFEYATEQGLPVVLVSAGGGGARMHEGILSLMQMAKTSQAVARHNEAGLLYISVLTDPTMGGVYASFASLADIILAEPRALIGFAGPRLVEETIGQQLPPGFQRAEYALENGMIDKIVSRRDLKNVLTKLLGYHLGGGGSQWRKCLNGKNP